MAAKYFFPAYLRRNTPEVLKKKGGTFHANFQPIGTSLSATKYGTAVPLDRGREVLEKYSKTPCES